MLGSPFSQALSLQKESIACRGFILAQHTPEHEQQMSDPTPQVEAQLDELATICCQKLESESANSSTEESTIDSLLRSLVMGGYARNQNRPLQVEIEHRAKEKCREPAMHRGGALSSICSQMQSKFEELVRQESTQPTKENGPKAANVSSATNA